MHINYCLVLSLIGRINRIHEVAFVPRMKDQITTIKIPEAKSLKHGQNGRVVAANVEYERLSIGFDYNINHLVSVPGLDRVMMRKKVKRLEMSLGLRHLRRCL